MEEKILREILATTKENNEMLRKLNLHRRFLTFYWFFKWLLIAAIAYSAYLAASPYIESAQETISNINDLNTQAQQFKQMDQKSFSEYLREEISKRINP